MSHLIAQTSLSLTKYNQLNQGTKLFNYCLNTKRTNHAVIPAHQTPNQYMTDQDAGANQLAVEWFHNMCT
jgi:hypothetical protein